MTHDPNSQAEVPWGTLAPTGPFAALLDASRRSGNSALARLAMWLAPEATDIETLGFKARLHPKDNLSEKRALVSPQRFDPAELAFLCKAITPEFCFIDIGANCGIYTLHLAARAGAGARFVAVDPQPEMLRRLHYNLAINDFAAPVEIHDLAISDKAGTLTFHVNTHNRGESGLITSGEEIRVNSVTLLDLMNTAEMEQASAIKIDVEGAEMRILSRFFEDAPSSRWPGILVLESLYSNAERDPVGLAQEKGYEIALNTGRNVILAR